MRTARPLETVLAALAVMIATWPLETLLRTPGWVCPTATGIAVVAVTGLVLRLVRVPPWVALLAQLVAVVLATTWLHGLGSGPFGLPAADLPARVHAGIDEGLRTIRSYAAPAPATPGIVLLVGLLSSLVAVGVDHLVVVRRAASVAGFPLLVVYLVSVVNTPGALPIRYFCALALAWLLLLVEQQRSRLGRWSTINHGGPRGPRVRLAALGPLGWFVALVAVAVAAAGQLALPQLPTRFLSEGLGRQHHRSAPTLSFGSDVDINRNLSDRDPSPVLTYSTPGDPNPPPLAVAVAQQYLDGHWRVLPTAVPDAAARPGDLDVGLPQGVNPDLPHAVKTATIADNHSLRTPQIAVPAPVVGADIAAPWAREPQSGLVGVSRQTSRYVVRYAAATLTPQVLAREDSGSGDAYGSTAHDDADLVTVDPSARDLVREVTTQVLRQDRRTYARRGSDYDKAMAIQEYLRSPAFTYSLTLPPLTDEERAAGMRPDALSHFLRTKTGYCTQFSTAMVMMARSEQIPARVVLGFLPGSVGPDGRTRTVRAADAHAWPELFIEGVGWTRFEPTPGTRSGQAPAYAQPPAAPTPTVSQRSTSAAPRPTSTSAAPRSTSPTASAAPSARSGPGPAAAIGRGLVALVGLVALGLLVSGRALLAARRRSRRLDQAGSPAAAVEARWTTVREQLGDLGVEVPLTLTPRAQQRWITENSRVPESAHPAAQRILATVERARYAPTGAGLPPAQVDADARTLLAAVRRCAPWRVRVRALLAPRLPR